MQKRQSYKLVTNNQFAVTTLNYFTNSNPGKIIILFPPVDGTNQLDRTTANYFCKQGVSTVIIDSWTGSDFTYDIQDIAFHQTELESAKRAVLMLTNNLYRDKNVGILAFSKGAIGASVYKDSFTPNVKSMFLVVPGAPLHLTISRAGENKLSTLRQQRLLFYRIDQNEYDKLIYDALAFRTARSKGRLKVAMVTANKDTTVPTYLQNHLVEKWRPDVHWTTEYGHFRTVVYTHLSLKSSVYDFFINSL